MQASFNSRTYNFNTLLGRSSFPDYPVKQVVVPPFQRGYSWEKTHVATLWEDIIEFHKQIGQESAASSYFLGPIVILPTSKYISLLDGQQRLATITILLSVIRDVARQRGGQPGSDLARDIQRDLLLVDDEEEIYALVLNNLDRGYFREHVQKDPPSDKVRATIRSHRLIRQAKQFLKQAVEKEIEGLEGKELVRHLKALKKTIAERIKMVTIEVNSEDEAFLIFETLNDRGLRLAVPDLLLNYLMREASSSGEREQIREKWDLVITQLGMRKVSTFLRHMWVSRYGDVKRQALYREIRDTLKKDKALSSLDFADICADESCSYAAIINLDKSRLKNAYPYIEGLVKYLLADKALPLLLSGLVCLETPEFEKLARYTESLVVRHSVFANLNPSELEDALYEAARALRQCWEENGSSKKCLQRPKEILERVNPSREQIISGIQECFLGKRYAKYIVRRLAEFKQDPSGIFVLDKASLEHIFPQNAVGEKWPDRADLEPYVWHIGNLTLLEPSLNRDVGNANFETKKEIYSKSKIAITQQICHYSEWNPETIKQRARELAKAVEQVWRLP